MVIKMHTLEELEVFALENHIPIARHQVVEYMVNLIQEKNYKSFFEIGTAIGYTSIIIYKSNPNIRLVTIENDLERVVVAQKNFLDFNIQDKIQFIIDDATLYNTDELFDLIFIDAAKKKNQFFFDKFSKNLKDGGTIIVDNMNLQDLWLKINVKKRAKYNQINQDFKDYICSLKDYNVEIFDNIGDGIAVITKK